MLKVSPVTKIIVMAAGVSSRMRNSEAPIELHSNLVEQANTKHKSMIEVGSNGEPFMQLQLKNIADAGIKEVAFVVSPVEHSIKEFFSLLNGTDDVYGLILHFVEQHIESGRSKPSGTGDAVLQAIKSLPGWEQETVLVVNGDNLYSTNAYKIMMQDPTTNGLLSYDPVALGFDDERLTRLGNVVAKEGILIKIVEKPTLTELLELRSLYTLGVSMSVFRFVMPQVILLLENLEFDPIRDEKEITTVVAQLVQKGIDVFVPTISETIFDLTTKQDIVIVQHSLKNLV
jgi:glucose-1-phosphate adenylyltransferase